MIQLPSEMDRAFLFPLFLGAPFHKLTQPQNSCAHSLEGELCIWQPEGPPDQNQEYVEAAEIFEPNKIGPCRA